jgi:hypothetical protein
VPLGLLLGGWGGTENENLLTGLYLSNLKTFVLITRVMDLYIKTDDATFKSNCNFWIYFLHFLSFLANVWSVPLPTPTPNAQNIKIGIE